MKIFRNKTKDQGYEGFLDLSVEQDSDGKRKAKRMAILYTFLLSILIVIFKSLLDKDFGANTSEVLRDIIVAILFLGINCIIAYISVLKRVRILARAKKKVGDLNERIFQLQHHDPNTGINNRVSYEEHVKQILEGHETHMLLQIEVCDYENMVLAQGSESADRYMIDFVDHIRRVIRGDVYHIYGNTLKVIHKTEKTESMLRVVDRVSRHYCADNTAIVHEGDGCTNVGIIRFPKDGTSLEELDKCLQLALKKSKEYGKGRLVVYNSCMNSEQDRHEEVSAFIEKALKEDSFQLHMQPVVDLSTGQLKKAEMLLRHSYYPASCPNTGVLIEAAEKSGQIVSIDQMVVKKAFELIKTFQVRNADVIFSINLSTLSFQSTELFNRISEYLAIYKLDPGMIEFEITEHTIMADMDVARDLLNRFKEKGFRLALDDFGIAYSSLNYLSKLPIDVIKIDREYIDELVINNQYKSIVRLVISLAKELGMVSLAEGIESGEQLAVLKELGCNLGQGYYFDKALPPEIFWDEWCGDKSNKAS